jgi:hypothetical protein
MKPRIRKNLLHYGLQRSGTNFLETLLKKKYRVRFLNSNTDRSSPLQKHFRLYDNKEVIPEPQYRNNIKVKNFDEFERLLETLPDYYVVISKDPYSWFLSYSNWAKKCNWPTVAHHYIKEYNLFYGKWLEFSGQTDKIVFVRYIDLLQNTDLELERLETKMKLQKKLLMRLMPRKVDKVSQSSSFTGERRVYYLSEKYIERYTTKELRVLNLALDPRVISFLGYEKR